MNLRRWTTTGVIVAGAFALAGCNLSGESPKPYAQIKACWDPGNTTSVEDIIKPHLTRQVDTLLRRHDAPDSLLKKLHIRLALTSRHATGVDPLIGKVECAGDIAATISGGPGYPSVDLSHYGLAYRIYPAQNGMVIETRPAALDDEVSAHENDLVRLAQAVYAGKPTEAAKPAAKAPSSPQTPSKAGSAASQAQ